MKQAATIDKKTRKSNPSPDDVLKHNPFIAENLDKIIWPWDMIFFGTDNPDYDLMRARIAKARDKKRSAIPKHANRSKRLRIAGNSLKPQEENSNDKRGNSRDDGQPENGI